MMTRRGILGLCALVLLAARLCAVDLNLRLAAPEISYALGSLMEDGSGTYSFAYGLRANADLELFHFVTLGPEGFIGFLPLVGVTDPILHMGAGLSVGFYAIPVARLKCQVAGTWGVYDISSNTDLGVIEAKAYADFYARGEASVIYRVNPSLAISLNAFYYNNFYHWTTLYNSVGVSLSLGMALDLTKAKDEINLEFEQDDAVFPAIGDQYLSEPVGTITISNHEQSEIRDVSVEFASERYTATPTPCGTISILQKGQSAKLPLLAGFSDAILQFNEDGQLPGQITVSYSMIGASRRVSKTKSIKVHNRNSFRWADPTVLAAFVSPNNPDVLDYSKFVVGVARNQLRTGLNRNMQFGLYLFEALRLSGITYSPDATTPYAATHLDPAKVDYIQFPAQTLAFKSGDADDIGVLYAACLESTGVGAAIIPLADDFIVCIRLGIKSEEADRYFDGEKSYLKAGGDIWLPIAMRGLREGFVNSWYAGLAALEAAKANGSFKDSDMIVLKDAWLKHVALGLDIEGTEFQKPTENQLVRAAENGMIRYISSEIGPKIRAVQLAIGQKGDDAGLYNQLGLLYVRAGMYDEATQIFQQAAQMGGATALVNLGNLASLQKDYESAVSYYTQALAKLPDNKAAQTGLARANAELGN